MLRRRIAVPALLGLLGLVWAGAHAIAHDVAPHPAGAGHARESYLAFLPTSMALCLALALALALATALGGRWTGSFGRSLWLFGVVPVLGFAVDLLTELPAHGQATLSGTAVVTAELVPVLLFGLLVQIPVALVAVGLATRIIWLAESLAWAPTSPSPGPARGAAGHLESRSSRSAGLLLAGSIGSRAPPVAQAA